MPRRSHSTSTDHTILVVDDQEEARASVLLLLQRRGHRVLQADSGECALDLFKQHQVDLLLVDHMMPRMDGPELVRRIRGLDPFVQIIMQTGYGGNQLASTTLNDLGIQGYHDKSDGPDKLLLWVESALASHATISALRRRLQPLEGVASSACILVVRPASTATDAMVAQLTAHEYRVVTAPSCDSALDLFVRECPDVVVADDTILSTDGAAFVQRLRAIDAGVPLISHSTMEPQQDRLATMRRLSLHGIVDGDQNPEAFLELVQSAVAGMRRVQWTRATQDLRGLVLAKLCHGLRSRLHVIRGYVDVLETDPAAAPVQDVIGRLAGVSDATAGMVQEYLDLARLEAPGVVVRRDVVPIDTLLDELRGVADRQIGARPLSLRTQVAVPGAAVCTDGEKLRAILVELLMNAIKFSVSGEIGLDVHSSHQCTEFILTDTGPGIDATELSALVRPFRQRGDAELTSVPGQGVGLALVLRLSALIGASLTARAAEPVGTTFTLSLPTNRPPAPTVH